MDKTPFKKTRKRGGMKQVILYKKDIVIPIVGTDQEELQRVAQIAHIAVGSHPLVSGGRGKRKVFVGKSQSTKPTKVFDGVA